MSDIACIVQDVRVLVLSSWKFLHVRVQHQPRHQNGTRINFHGLGGLGGLEWESWVDTVQVLVLDFDEYIICKKLWFLYDSRIYNVRISASEYTTLFSELNYPILKHTVMYLSYEEGDTSGFGVKKGLSTTV